MLRVYIHFYLLEAYERYFLYMKLKTETLFPIWERRNCISLKVVARGNEKQ